MCCSSGDSTAKAAEQQSLVNEQQQNAFNQQLIGMFQQQFGKQNAITDFLTSKVEPLINNPTGYSDQAQAALRASANDTLTTNYGNAQRALQSKEFAQGSRDIPSDVNSQLDEALFNAEASDKSAAANNITLANENLKNSNYWNAINALSGNAAQINPLGYAGAATGASGASSAAGNSVGGLSNAVTASQGPSFGSILGGIVGGGVSAFAGGGFGKLLGCWVASAIYGGWYEPRTVLVRTWLNTEFIKHWYGRMTMHFYRKHGQWVAKQPMLVAFLTPLFNLALKRATD